MHKYHLHVTAITYADSCSQYSYALKFKAYFPKNTAYTHYSTCPLPWIGIWHPGGYSDCSTIDNEDNKWIKLICREFAKRGIIAVNFEYREGQVLLPNGFDPLTHKTVYFQLGVYRARQDVDGGLRSFIKMYYDGVFGTAFRIDTSKMFLGGGSAGGGAVLNYTYLQKQDMADEISPDIHAHLGSVKADYYYADTTYPIPRVKGCFIMWADFPMPGTKTTDTAVANFFARNNYIAPYIGFQGLKDPVVIDSNRYEDFPKRDSIDNIRGTYDTTSFCLDSGGICTLHHTTVLNSHDLRMIGPETLYALIQNKGKKAVVCIDSTMRHGLDDDGANFKSNFGIPLPTTQKKVQIYMVQRAACLCNV